MIEQLVINIEPATDPQIGLWLGAMQQVRKNTIKIISDCTLECIEWPGPTADDITISGLLYHIGKVEMAWLYMDLLCQELPDQIQQRYPVPSRDESGKIVNITGITVSTHLEMLAESRLNFLEVLSRQSLDDWRRLRTPVNGPKYETNPEWIVFHLIEHEAGHAAQISSMKARWNRWCKNQNSPSA